MFGFDALKLLNFLCLCDLLCVKFLFVYMTLIAGSSSAPKVSPSGRLEGGNLCTTCSKKSLKGLCCSCPSAFFQVFPLYRAPYYHLAYWVLMELQVLDRLNRAVHTFKCSFE